MNMHAQADTAPADIVTDIIALARASGFSIRECNTADTTAPFTVSGTLEAAAVLADGIVRLCSAEAARTGVVADPASAYKDFCALRDHHKPGAEAPTYTEAQAFALALLPQPQTTFPHPAKETAMSHIDLFITTPPITLPNGTVVQPFQVGQYLTGTASNHNPVITAEAEPRVQVSYFEAQKLAEEIGCKLITELQYLAIAHDIANQDINWTGGKVGEGSIYQGLHLGNVDKAQPGAFVSDEPSERRWHQLSNGERVYDFAGNAYSWVFDDVQGDERGLVAKPFAEESPSIATAPHARMTKGMGWRPLAGADWSGDALVRGGCWDDGGNAGVFRLGYGWPDYRVGSVGFRCTK